MYTACNIFIQGTANYTNARDMYTLFNKGQSKLYMLETQM